MVYPAVRLRRLRKNESIRRLVRGTALGLDDLVLPIFVREDRGGEIKSLPGQKYYTPQTLDKIIDQCEEAKIPGLLIFGIPRRKDEVGSEAFSDGGPVQKAVRLIKEISKLAVFTDVCLCQYTSHGHCGIVDEMGVNNDKTLEALRRISLSHAKAGADFIAPSSMMDGQVKAIREALDGEGFEEVGIMSYSVKFASTFYLPFRDAAKSSPQKVKGLPHLLDRRSYQLDFRSSKQAMREIALDVQEGVDIVMVKPALLYLDVIREAKRRFDIPLAAFLVSGEHVMVKLAADQGALNEREAFLEIATSIKRAGADFIITYAALDLARWLDED